MPCTTQMARAKAKAKEQAQAAALAIKVAELETALNSITGDKDQNPTPEDIDKLLKSYNATLKDAERLTFGTSKHPTHNFESRLSWPTYKHLVDNVQQVVFQLHRRNFNFFLELAKKRGQEYAKARPGTQYRYSTVEAAAYRFTVRCIVDSNGKHTLKHAFLRAAEAEFDRIAREG